MVITRNFLKYLMGYHSIKTLVGKIPQQFIEDDLVKLVQEIKQEVLEVCKISKAQFPKRYLKRNDVFETYLLPKMLNVASELNFSQVKAYMTILTTINKMRLYQNHPPTVSEKPVSVQAIKDTSL